VRVCRVNGEQLGFNRPESREVLPRLSRLVSGEKTLPRAK
jgi:hypothetical protein